jgi:GNAT superfamily N-acetyltransferase
MIASVTQPSLPTSTSPTSLVNTERRLDVFLRSWLGSWPPHGDLELLVWPGRDRPGWDGTTLPGLGVESPAGTVLSLSPSLVNDVDALDLRQILTVSRSRSAATALPALLGAPELRFSRATFRWCERPAALPEIGEWVAADDPRLPAWLHAFNSDVLVTWDRVGRYAAGVGRKRHNPYGHELAVGTDPAHRGRGLASKLVAQAARCVLADGALPIYRHDPANTGSARVANRAGFPDRGWRVLSLRSP